MVVDGFGDLIGLVFRSLIGFGVFFGLLYWAFNVQARMWRALVASYGQARQAPVLARKIPETIVINDTTVKGWQLGGRPKYQTYFGTIISVLEDGLLISAIPPISFISAYKGIYLPFCEMKLEPYPWMLWKKPYAISMNKRIQPESHHWSGHGTMASPKHGTSPLSSLMQAWRMAETGRCPSPSHQVLSRP